MASRSYSSLGSGLGAFVYRLFVAIIELMIVRGKPRRMLEAEVIALRHQVAVLQRTSRALLHQLIRVRGEAADVTGPEAQTVAKSSSNAAATRSIEGASTPSW